MSWGAFYDDHCYDAKRVVGELFDFGYGCGECVKGFSFDLHYYVIDALDNVGFLYALHHF